MENDEASHTYLWQSSAGVPRRALRVPDRGATGLGAATGADPWLVYRDYLGGDSAVRLLDRGLLGRICYADTPPLISAHSHHETAACGDLHWLAAAHWVVFLDVGLWLSGAARGLAGDPSHPAGVDRRQREAAQFGRSGGQSSTCGCRTPGGEYGTGAAGLLQELLCLS